MNQRLFVVAALATLIAFSQSTLPVAFGQAGYAVTAVPAKDVTINDAFWTPRIENNRRVSLPGLIGNDLPNMRVLEAICYSLQQHPDPGLQAWLDSQLDDAIAAARNDKGKWPQKDDGSLPTPGYFFELAVAHHELTGSRKLLDVAIEVADDIDAVFGPGKRHDISNHEGIKNGLVRLYGATKNEKYLKLAQFFLERRGNHDHREVMYGQYAQDHKPVVQQDRAIGHSVRATYLYMALTDIAALTGKPEYRRADELIWNDAVSKRTFLTGGIGTYRDEEDFSDDYDLPNLCTWNEICAAYGSTMWNQRMFLLEKDSRYADMLERTLYNGFLVGISLDGRKYLYQAPLRTYGDFTRHSAFGPNCCPPNIVRLFPQLGGMIYAHDDAGLFVNLYIASKAKLNLAGGAVEVSQETGYPWDGAIKFTVNPATARRFALNLRIPGWARDEPMPGGLYRYAPVAKQPISLRINGAAAEYANANGYAKIDREWKAGDTVEFNIPMPVRRVLADERVLDDRGMVALERGPLVYCLEQADNGGGVFNLQLPDESQLNFAYRDDVLGGIGTITGSALLHKRIPGNADAVPAGNRGADGAQNTAASRHIMASLVFTAVPYYAFANREPGEMSVWIARDPRKAWMDPAPSIASTSKASSSVGEGTVADNYPGHNPPTIPRRFYPGSQDGSGSLKALSDQLEPVNSADGSAPFFRMRPQTGDQAWVQYDFAKPQRVSSVDVYWKDDKQAVIPPKSWRLVYRDGNEWKPITTTNQYGVATDQFNRVAFTPVTTSALRLEITLQPKVYKKNTLGPPDGNYLQADLTWYEGGIIEWRVNP